MTDRVTRAAVLLGLARRELEELTQEAEAHPAGLKDWCSEADPREACAISGDDAAAVLRLIEEAEGRL